jgi:hypothetical protein
MLMGKLAGRDIAKIRELFRCTKPGVLKVFSYMKPGVLILLDPEDGVSCD